MRKFERQCSSQASVKRLRVHPSYTSFHNKWNLPVYFQLRCVLPHDLYSTYYSQYILHYVQRTSPTSLLYTFHTMIVQLCGGEICAKVLTSLSLFVTQHVQHYTFIPEEMVWKCIFYPRNQTTSSLPSLCETAFHSAFECACSEHL